MSQELISSLWRDPPSDRLVPEPDALRIGVALPVTRLVVPRKTTRGPFPPPLLVTACRESEEEKKRAVSNSKCNTSGGRFHGISRFASTSASDKSLSRGDPAQNNAANVCVGRVAFEH